MNLLPQNASPLERAIAATGAGIDTLPVALRDLWNPATCPVTLLPWLAWSLAVDEWDETWSEGVKRSVVADAIEVHRHRGTVWSLKRSLAPLGMAIDVIDQATQRASYAQLNAAQLDGSWQLDSTAKIRPIELYANLPQIQHWAQFIVRANLADAIRAENFALLRHLVQKWKPARSWPIFMFWLSFMLDVRAQASAALQLQTQSDARFPWLGRTIGNAVRWPLGRDGVPVKLPQPMHAFRLGEQRGAISACRLQGGRVVSTTMLQSTASASVFRLPVLAENGRSLNGTWRIGGQHISTFSLANISARSVIAAPSQLTITHHVALRMDYPVTPAKLGARAKLAPWRRLDGRWTVGSNSANCRFGFALRRDSAIQAEAKAQMTSTAEAYISPERLARRAPVSLGATARRLDGSWRPGAENRLGNFCLDGRRLRARRFSTRPRIGMFSVMQDVADKAGGSPRRLPLNGQWRIGASAAPQFNINIIKEVKHG
ncbi:phage tail protein I [Janthinobacterium sp.]|uniref:phage tail protein I n=1 Tax=Janthinobacterium sp. TaxID=1871054 RepID=UPI0026051AC0|nr:phage tail protein I [Janthinobacterium sp.]